jgi:16S rRNA (guanine(966)-N(2))-methyltransferase RsmD
MRVTGGSARGTPLLAPKGQETRPTTDRVREAIFSILFSMDADLSRVLDLYAGTGALAIEALSRSAGSADLVERAPVVCTIIRRNLERTRLSGRTRVLCMDVRRALDRLAGPYSLVFLDPPYADPQTDALLATLGASSVIGEGSTIVLEHAHARTPPPAIGPLALVSDRRYGDTGVAFYR